MRKSEKTVRLQGVDQNVTYRRLEEIALELCQKPQSDSLRASRDLLVEEPLRILGTSLVEHADKKIATVTYISEKIKDTATAKFQSSKECVRLDDKFSGLTLLYGGDGSSIDVESVALLAQKFG